MNTNYTLLDGQALARAEEATLKATVNQRLATGWSTPTLATILLGEHEPSKIYLAHKAKVCARLGIRVLPKQFERSLPQADLMTSLDELNHDNTVHGILVQLPLSAHINIAEVVAAIHPDKDVDGFHPSNMGRLVRCEPGLRPCTPRGVMRLLEHYNIPISKQKAVVVGASNIVGRPMGLELLAAGATVTQCHSLTQHLADEVRTADILISATGVAHLIQADWIKQGAVVVDVGIIRMPGGKLTGDVDFAEVSKKTSFISPVPGGVGPMTIASLMANVLKAQALQHNC